MQYTATASTGERVTFALETLPQAFAIIPDPRRAQNVRYSGAAIVSLAIAEWTTRQTRHVRRALGFHHDTMSHRITIQRLLGRLDPDVIAALFRGSSDPHVPGKVREHGSQGVALDGKDQRGRLRHGATSTHPIPAVSAVCHDLGGMLAQLVIDAQQHEAALTVAGDPTDRPARACVDLRCAVLPAGPMRGGGGRRRG